MPPMKRTAKVQQANSGLGCRQGIFPYQPFHPNLEVFRRGEVLSTNGKDRVDLIDCPKGRLTISVCTFWPDLPHCCQSPGGRFPWGRTYSSCSPRRKENL